jgi:glutamate-1-semialdehyde 2,1-aminomutase
MDSSLPILSLSAAAVAGAAAVFPKLQARLALSRAKHRSLTGHSKMSKMVARLLPHYEFDIDGFFCSDGAPGNVATPRQDAFFRLASLYKERYAKGRKMTAEAAAHISDLQFTESYRVPFQYSRLVREISEPAPRAVLRWRHRPMSTAMYLRQPAIRRQHL